MTTIQFCFFCAMSAMNVDHAGTYPASTFVNFSRSESTVVPAQIQGPSERGIDYQTITYEPWWCGAPVAHMLLHV
jgi:hypothetical protein